MGLSYEDLEVGTRYVVGSHTFKRDEVVHFAEQFDPQPFHISEAGGEASMFGGLVASGWHTCSVMMGMLVRNFLKDSTSMGSPGVDEIRWLKPTRVGDTLTMTNAILSKRVSASNSSNAPACTATTVEKIRTRGDAARELTRAWSAPATESFRKWRLRSWLRASRPRRPRECASASRCQGLRAHWVSG